MPTLEPISHLITEQEINNSAPISKRTLQRMGESINFALLNAVPLGTIIWQMLPQSEIDSILGSNKLVVCDGRNVVGTLLHTTFGFTNIPDLRGRFLRAKSLTSGNNPDGDLAVGSYTADKFKSHTHSYQATNDNGGGTDEGFLSYGTGNTNATGGNETAPKAVHLYAYIRIN